MLKIKVLFLSSGTEGVPPFKDGCELHLEQASIVLFLP
jgi:hypothetical protein